MSDDVIFKPGQKITGPTFDDVSKQLELNLFDKQLLKIRKAADEHYALHHKREIMDALRCCYQFERTEYSTGLAAAAVVLIEAQDARIARLEARVPAKSAWSGSVCPVCGESTPNWYDCDFCPHCGADMREAET